MNDAAFRDHITRLKTACRGREIAVDLGLHGRGKRFFCPECQAGGGKTPDLSVFDQGFKCYKCGASGDVIDLVVLAGRMSKAEAIAYLERRTGIERQKKGYQGMGRGETAVPGVSWTAISAISSVAGRPDSDGVNRPLYAAFLDQVCRPIKGTPGADYLVGRGIAAKVADKCGVRYCSDLAGLWKLADRKKIKAAGLSSLYVFQKFRLPFLVFPYIRRGQPNFIKTRCLLSKDEADRRQVPRFLNTGGTVPCLWNHDAIAGAVEILIAEGELDALAAIGKGFVAVGLPGWSHWKDAWTKDFIGKEVILVMDADEGGKKGTADIAKRFMRAGLPCPRQLVLTKGKDLNELLQSFRN